MNTATGVVVVGLAVASAAAVTWMADAPAPAHQEQTVTMTGCLRTGSGSTVFILRGATGEGAGSPRDYLLVDVAAGVDLAARVNRQIAVTGRVWGAGEGPSPPEAANTAERALRRQSVASLSEVASECLDPQLASASPRTPQPASASPRAVSSL
jgi:hypothetical protein